MDIQNIAAVLGILAIVCPFGLWLFSKVGNRLTPAEVEILVAAAKEGQIWLLKVDAFGQWVRADDHDFFDEKDPAFIARYNEAFTRLCSRGHIVHQGGDLYRLTGSGFDAARRLKARRPVGP